MSRRTAMQRPPRLSVVAPSEVDDEAATCSTRDSRVALAGLEMRPLAKSGVSYIEDSDVISSVGHDPDSVTSFAARPSYVARGEILTGETHTYSPHSGIPMLPSADVALEPDFAVRYENADAFARTEAIEAASLGLTREEPLVAPDDRSFENMPAYVDHTMLMPASTPTPMASVRPSYRSQMMSVPPAPESWVESPWVMPSARGQAFVVPPPAQNAKNILQTVAIIGTGVLMLAIVFGAVLFARSDSDERMQFSPQHAIAASQPLPVAAPAIAPATMQVITTAAAPVAPKARVVAASTAAPVAAPTMTPRVKEQPPRARIDAPRPAARVEKAEKVEATPKKTKEEESVEALLRKLGEEQLSR